jgi:NADPH:quinone reductase-like Zn-dependent oxidoreductase
VRAIIWTKYGPPEVLKLKEVEKPVPRSNEVLIRIHVANVTAGDCEMRKLKFPFPFLGILIRLYTGVRKPKRIKVLGQEFAGEIESVGKDVKLYKKGDQVFAATDFKMGAYAEYNCVSAEGGEGIIEIKPKNMTYEEAATIPVGGLNALHFLKKGNIQNAKKVLINGAGGSIGTIAIQLAKYFGAEVTAVDSTKKLDMLLSIGADKVIDFTKEDWTKRGEIYDIVFDVVGKSSYSRCIKSLNEEGIFVSANPTLSMIFRGPITSRLSSKKVMGGTVTYKREDIIFLRDLIETSKVKTVIDKLYPISQTADAHEYVETGNKKGNVVITLKDD